MFLEGHSWPMRSQLLLVACLVSVPACPASKPEAGPDAAALPGLDAAALVPEDAVAVVNGRPIYRVRLEAAIGRLAPEHQVFARSPAGQRSLVESLVEEELLEQEAQRLGLPDQPAVKERLEASRRQILREALVAGLEVEPVTEADVEAHRREHPEVSAEQARTRLETAARQDATVRYLKEIRERAGISRPEPASP